MPFGKESALPGEEKLYFGWIEKDHISLMKEKCPSLLDKLNSLKANERLFLDNEEKNFLLDCLDRQVPLMSNFISGVAGKVWSGTSVKWKDKVSGKWRQENLAAGFWHAFKNNSDLIDFYLGTSKEEAQQICQEFYGGMYGPETVIE